jgi:anti-sigma-K factor RskA
MTAAEVHALTGPYALGALPEFERREFERHLADCQSCRAEVAELRETATRLAAPVAVEPSADLRRRVLAAAASTRQLPPDAGERPAAGRRTGLSRRSVLAVAAGGLVVAGTGGLAIDRYREAARLRSENDELAALLTEPDALLRRGPVTGGGRATVVTSVRRDAAVVLLEGMPAPPDRRTYQLWFLEDGGARSLGLAGSNRASTTVSGGIARANAFGLTVEPAGGSAQPTLPTVAQFPLT